jgi:hypothetical protein
VIEAPREAASFPFTDYCDSAARGWPAAEQSQARRRRRRA